jgi:hypothetical protein
MKMTALVAAAVLCGPRAASGLHGTAPTFGNDALGRERVRRIDDVLGDADTEAESAVVTDASGRCLALSDHTSDCIRVSVAFGP